MVGKYQKLEGLVFIIKGELNFSQHNIQIKMIVWFGIIRAVFGLLHIAAVNKFGIVIKE